MTLDGQPLNKNLYKSASKHDMLRRVKMTDFADNEVVVRAQDPEPLIEVGNTCK